MGALLSVCEQPLGGRRRGPGHGVRSYQAPVGTRPAASVGGPEPRFSGRKRALLVGINYVGTRGELRGCQNDALGVRQLLCSHYSFPPQEVRLLIDSGQGGHQQPTRANIFEGVRWLISDARPGDCLFFHYSGHGAQQEDPTCHEEDAMDETILPVDFETAGQIIDNELFDALCGSLPSGVKLTALMDCCHSGSGLDLPLTYDQYQGWVEDDNPCHSEGDVQLLSGSMDSQTSADVQAAFSKPGGAMTMAFLDTIQRNPKLTYDQLLTGIRRHCSNNGHSQVPQLSSSQRFDTNKKFEILGSITPNQNPTLGRHFNKRKHPKAAWLNDANDPLGGMLMDMAPAMLLGGLMGGGGMGDGFGGGGGDGFSNMFGGGNIFGGDGGGGFGGGDFFGGGGLGDGEDGFGFGDFGGGGFGGDDVGDFGGGDW